LILDSKKRFELVQVLSHLVDSLSESEKKSIFNEVLGKKDGIPISIFRSGLAGLEALTVFLKQQGTEISKIATLLNRNRNTIYTTFGKAQKKLKGKLDTSDYSFSISIDVFSNRKFSILESLVAHLKDKHGLRFVTISKLLGKNYSTVKTVYSRYKKKS
jgi:hypothetical protein